MKRQTQARYAGFLPLCRSTLLTSTCFLAAGASAAPRDYFRIHVVDADTGRGVPLVELKTTNDVRYITDSNGIVAIDDPDFMGQKVYFSVKSHGYEFPKDGFGNSGMALPVAAGGVGEIKLKRLNIAERLYRITGAGIYRDSVLAGVATPFKQSSIPGLVMGQDTVEATLYKGKIFWLWGDTNRAAYPLGNFKTSSATSLPPGQGGLDPALGVALTYWVNDEGFSKEMIPLPSSSPIWMGGLFTLRDAKNGERLFGSYSKAESDSKSTEHGLAVFNDDKALFEKVGAFDSTLSPGGDPFQATAGGKTYLYFDPFERVLADYGHVIDGKQYQAYTPLVAGTKFDGANTQLERGAGGQLVYGWKTNTGEVDENGVKTLVEAGKMKAEESPLQLRDIETGAVLDVHGSSTYWNPFRKRWVQIFSQAFGASSYLGELWFAEADTPTGPWVYARKVLTHDKYTFYNPTQHPFFAQDGGRLIYFEGTYTATYSGAAERTPRYDYNQMMYRLALDDPRLTLPVAIYRLKNGEYGLRDALETGAKWPQIERIPFFAMPPGEKSDALIPIYATGTQLQTETKSPAKPLFYALAATETDASKASALVVPLYQYTQGDRRWYSVDGEEKGEGLTRAEKPLCRVWRNPSSVISYDWETKPVQ